MVNTGVRRAVGAAARQVDGGSSIPVKLRLIFTALAVLVATSAVGLVLMSSRTRGVAPATAEARAERAAALAFADRFAGAPIWDTAYVTPVQTQTSTTPVETRTSAVPLQYDGGLNQSCAPLMFSASSRCR